MTWITGLPIFSRGSGPPLLATIFSNRRACIPLLAGLLFARHLQAADDSLTVNSEQYKNAVVELYTSEGCSSCPPADEWLSSLSKLVGEDEDPQVIPLAFHVDYWNDLGWVDPYSNAAFTDRQHMLAARNRQPTVYTPEFVVNGKETRGARKTLAAITQSNAEPAGASIHLTASRQGDDVLRAEVAVSGVAPLGTPGTQLYAALFENNLSGVISAGENAGRTLQHAYVVRSWTGPFAVDTKKPFSFDIELGRDWRREQLGLAVLVVDKESGKLLQAVKTPLKNLF
ncbi:MAG: DUF1223 domain-containing protein [Pseudomonadota bacterium]|nr:DUF1223 domain-containing protein [Pseudomonadota bacterium]